MRSKAPLLAIIALVVLIFLAGQLGQEAPPPPDQGPRAAASEGRLALARLLEASGFDVLAWDKRPGSLPRRPGLVWLERLPEPFLSGEGGELPGDEPLREALARGLASPMHYRRFAAQGGSLLVEVGGAEAWSRLREEFGLFELEHLSLVEAPADAAPGTLELTWAGAETLRIAATSVGTIEGRESVQHAQALLEDADGRCSVLEVPVGRGRLVLVACGEAFDNQRLAVADHAVLAVRLAERAPRGGTIHLDESRGLGGEAPSLSELALLPRALPLTAALGALALAFLWRAFAEREIPRDAPPIELLAARTRALARARLLQRARRHDLLAELLRDGVTRRLGAVLRIPPAASVLARTGAEHALAWARLAGAGADEDRWIEALTRPVGNATELARLDADLRALESRLERASEPSLHAPARLRARLLAAHDPTSPAPRPLP